MGKVPPSSPGPWTQHGHTAPGSDRVGLSPPSPPAEGKADAAPFSQEGLRVHQTADKHRTVRNSTLPSGTERKPLFQPIPKGAERSGRVHDCFTQLKGADALDKLTQHLDQTQLGLPGQLA